MLLGVVAERTATGGPLPLLFRYVAVVVTAVVVAAVAGAVALGNAVSLEVLELVVVGRKAGRRWIFGMPFFSC